MTIQGEERPRRRDRGFQRPSGPALVARPEPLAGPESAAAPPQEAPSPSAEAVPAAEAPQPQPTPASTTAAARSADAADADLPMPPSRHTEIRVQFNTKLRPAVIERTKGFADHYRANIQDIVEQALDEYLTRRGWASKPNMR